jgi:hypothetical protein
MLAVFSRGAVSLPGASGTEQFLFFFLAPEALHTWSHVLRWRTHIGCSVKRDGRCARSRQEGAYILAEVTSDPVMRIAMGFMAAKTFICGQ